MLVPLQKLPPAPRLFSGGPGGSLPSLCRRAAAAADPVPASLPGRARAAQEASEQGSTRRITRALVAGALIVASMSSAALEASAAAFHPPALVLAAEEDVMRPRFYMDQVSDAMPLKTMRGVWRYKEKREGRVCNARLVFEGKDDEPNRGEVRLESVGIASCYDALAPAKAIRGKWLMKPAKFEGRPSAGGGTIGTIQFNARWKLRSQQGIFIYRGDISADPIQGTGALPEATIKGEILKNTGNENYKRVGSFEGDLAEALSRPDEMEGAGDEDE